MNLLDNRSYLRIIIINIGIKSGSRQSMQEDKKPSRLNHTLKKRRIESQELLGEEGELIIEHAGQEYLLRRTRQDKLILTK